MPSRQTPVPEFRNLWNFKAVRALGHGPARGLAALAVLGMLAACSSGPRLDQAQLAAQYAANSPGNYRPPGPPEDPWGPYIEKASARFDVPQQWIRAVMQQESGGNEYLNGHLTTSASGAMGLMQVMPETYEELRAENNLGPDPYNPLDNILAGTAYIREMYDLYGSPGFLAAYNAGPGRYSAYLNHRASLPYETRQYVASIAPNLGGGQPGRVSQAQQYAMNRYPATPPQAPYHPPVQVASSALPSYQRERDATVPVTTTSLPQPPQPPMMRTASATPQRSTGGFHLVSRAVASTMPMPPVAPVAGSWAIQVGAYDHAAEAERAASMARSRSQVLQVARTYVGQVHVGHGVLYRARLVGLSREAALQGCEAQHGHLACMVLSPGAQG